MLCGLLAVVVLVAVVVIWLRLHRPGCPLLGIKVGNGSNGGRSAVNGSVQSLWEETTLAACAAQDGNVDHLQVQGDIKMCTDNFVSLKCGQWY